jgi:hypothetical protein
MTMNTRHLFLITCLGSAVALATGCGKKEEPAPASLEKKAGSALSQEAQKVTDAAKDVAAQAKAQAEAAKAAAEKAAAEVQAKAQSLIDSAKKSLSEGKLDQVQSALSQLKDLKLTPEQQQSLAELKQKLEAMLKDVMSKNPGATLPGGLVPNK